MFSFKGYDEQPVSFLSHHPDPVAGLEGRDAFGKPVFPRHPDHHPVTFGEKDLPLLAHHAFRREGPFGGKPAKETAGGHHDGKGQDESRSHAHGKGCAEEKQKSRSEGSSPEGKEIKLGGNPELQEHQKSPHAQENVGKHPFLHA